MLIEIIVLYSENCINNNLGDIVVLNEPSVFFCTKLADWCAITEVRESGNSILADLLLNHFLGANRLIFHHRSDISCCCTTDEQNAYYAKNKHPLNYRTELAEPGSAG
ncbi:hypothetical protein D3C76_583070 [compost metagenome]